MVEIEERIAIVKQELEDVKKERSQAKADQQNAILKLREEHHATMEALHQFMASLSRKKKQQQSDMKLYREVITEVFSDMYLPAFCVAKQAFLLRAVHTMMCFDQALFLLSQQCAESLKDFDRIIHGLEEDTATLSQDLLSKLILVERHIHQCEEGLAEAANRIKVISKMKLHRTISEEALDDVPLGDDSLDHSAGKVSASLRYTPKRGALSDRTLDTVSLSYVETSSFDGDQRSGFDVSPTTQKQQSIPKFVDHPTLTQS